MKMPASPLPILSFPLLVSWKPYERHRAQEQLRQAGRGNLCPRHSALSAGNREITFSRSIALSLDSRGYHGDARYLGLLCIRLETGLAASIQTRKVAQSNPRQRAAGRAEGLCSHGTVVSHLSRSVGRTQFRGRMGLDPRLVSATDCPGPSAMLNSPCLCFLIFKMGGGQVGHAPRYPRLMEQR